MVWGLLPNLFTPGSRLTKQPPVSSSLDTSGGGKTVPRRVSHLLLNAATQETCISVGWTEISHTVPSHRGPGGLIPLHAQNMESRKTQ